MGEFGMRGWHLVWVDGIWYGYWVESELVWTVGLGGFAVVNGMSSNYAKGMDTIKFLSICYPAFKI